MIIDSIKRSGSAKARDRSQKYIGKTEKEKDRTWPKEIREREREEKGGPCMMHKWLLTASHYFVAYVDVWTRGTAAMGLSLARHTAPANQP
jgi:hypothetical protein